MSFHQVKSLLPLFLLPLLALAHEEQPVDPNANYVQQHMTSEHHITDFDLESFFHLHDLDRDGILSTNELLQIYGVHHENAREGSPTDEHHDEKVQKILSDVLSALDKNGDGVVTKREFLEAGFSGLPNFKGIANLGHHYDAEGEYFLHHEELYHNSADTQTEAAYNHPEDIEHFVRHEDIERAEENLDRRAQGLPLLDKNGQEIPGSEKLGQQVPGQEDNPGGDNQQVFGGGKDDPLVAAASGRLTAAERYAAAKMEAGKRGDWGNQGAEFRKPKDLADRLRKSVPYKYRMKGSWWGEF